MSFELPQAISDSDEFRSLDEVHQLALVRRLHAIEDLAQSLASEARMREFDDFSEFVENLELDSVLLQELDGADGGGLTRWQLHHSWTFDTSPLEMATNLPAGLLQLVDLREPEVLDSLETYQVWFRVIGRHLARVLADFKDARSFSAALALHVVLDSLMARLVLACYKLRLSGSMPR